MNTNDEERLLDGVQSCTGNPGRALMLRFQRVARWRFASQSHTRSTTARSSLTGTKTADHLGEDGPRSYLPSGRRPEARRRANHFATPPGRSLQARLFDSRSPLPQGTDLDCSNEGWSYLTRDEATWTNVHAEKIEPGGASRTSTPVPPRVARVRCRLPLSVY